MREKERGEIAFPEVIIKWQWNKDFKDVMWTKKALESMGEDIRKGYWGRKKWDIHLKWTHTPTHTLNTLFSVRVTESPRVLSGMLGSHMVPQGGWSWSGLFPSPGRCTEASRWGPRASLDHHVVGWLNEELFVLSFSSHYSCSVFYFQLNFH